MDLYRVPASLFQKKYILPSIVVAASTAILIYYDEPLTHASQKFGHFVGISGEDNAKNISPFASVPFFVPTDLSTSLYYIGDGITEVAVNAGFYAYGIFAKDIRALRTASELSEGLIASGITVQILKHITGRESPFKATEPRGRWHFFPSWKEYNNSVPAHDAFPSGHLMSAMTTVTIIALNYPERHFIRPLGYALMGICAFQMMNNGVHWASDYPLALALGYIFGKVAVERGRTIIHADATIFPIISGNNIGLAFRKSF